MNVTLDRYWKLLISYLGPQGKRVGLLSVLLLGSIALQLAGPQILRAFIDRALAGAALSTLLNVALLFLVIALVTQVVTVAATYVAENIGWTATNQLRADVALHCLELDQSFHNERTPGELIERIDGDVGKLGNFFARFVVQVLGNALLGLGVAVLLFRVDWRVGLTLSGFAVVAIGAITALRNIAVPHWAAARQSSANLFGFLEERLAGAEDIRSAGATQYVMRCSHQHARDLLRKELRASVMGSATGVTSVLLFALGTALSLGIGAYLYRAGDLTIGTVYLIFTYAELLNRPIEQITRQMQDLQQASASITRVQDLLDTESRLAEGDIDALPPGALSVELDGVSFGYKPEDLVLHDVSLTLEPGAKLGLIGRTGSGKSSLTRLILRLYDPTAGVVRLSGVDLRDLRLQAIRDRVGVVTQEIQLFHATLRNNLTLFDPRIEDQAILNVLEDLGLGTWYESLPKGLDTRLATGGGDLSAGEAQLLAFAPVFLRDPDLVILDEASSRLDPSTERRMELALSRLLEGRTGIIIAHRLETVQRADYVMILDNGRTIEFGRREQLESDPGSRFSQMLRAGLEEAVA